MSGLRHAAEGLSLRSDSKRSQNDTHPTKSVNDGIASDWYDSHRRSHVSLEQRVSASAVSHTPLVHLGSTANDGDGTRLAVDPVNELITGPKNDGNGRAIRGSDAV
ncbi:hypothetical protein N7G274_010624 [Stereocaulon virgatum]|uniref:Uncharacterized protein n=1 Tax=Stereocaulon virgatum TaxID=373712 RepID=A0ABR3ZT97_9LECA